MQVPYNISLCVSPNKPKAVCLCAYARHCKPLYKLALSKGLVAWHAVPPLMVVIVVSEQQTCAVFVLVYLLLELFCSRDIRRVALVV